ncbi:dentin sialophosphoprotein-like [Acanthaster planci]|uniref:Dentin sialophosphoprotein-like n=1 Tax=Acanthaster planci TaxID=133434 RepID=A0A8B7ZZL9_ACAPL|nr:dentin sialophosphoprotein-like [Acanthaster planci]
MSVVTFVLKIDVDNDQEIAGDKDEETARDNSKENQCYIDEESLGNDDEGTAGDIELKNPYDSDDTDQDGLTDVCQFVTDSNDKEDDTDKIGGDMTDSTDQDYTSDLALDRYYADETNTTDEDDEDGSEGDDATDILGVDNGNKIHNDVTGTRTEQIPIAQTKRTPKTTVEKTMKLKR